MDVQSELLKFVNVYSGRNDVGNTPENKGECVGLSEVWIDVFGYPHIWGNAKDLLTNADPNFYEVILKTPTNFPQAGDIMVLKWGTLGHTGVVVEGADANQFSMFEQNDHTTNDPSGLCEVMQHNYNGVVGWIRFKNIEQNKTASVQNLAIDSHGLDLTNTKSLQVALDTWFSVANNQYVPATEYTKLQIQYDTVKQQLDTVQNASQPEINNYHAMQAVGYNTIDDITQSIKKKDDLILKLQQEQVLLEKKNEQLAQSIAEDSKNNYTGMEEGIKAVDRVRELEDYIVQVQKAAGINLPEPRNVISRVIQLKERADKLMKMLEDENKLLQMQRQAVTSMKQVQQNGVDWLMNAFRLQTDKEVK